MRDAGQPANKIEPLAADPLTGLANDRYFPSTLADCFERAREHETNGALLIVSLDNIVYINVTHGRSGGDEALRAVAYLLDNFRTSSSEHAEHALFKLSGPYYGYLIPSCPAPFARAIAGRLRESVEQSSLFLDRLTVSIGVVNFYELFLEDASADEIAGRIEQTALERVGIARRGGMNTVCDASELSEPGRSLGNVLLIDPDVRSLDLLANRLKAAQLGVRTAEDGETALSLVELAAPQAIICEAMTPRLDGFELRSRLRANSAWTAIPFILISHKKTEELIRKAVELDIRHYFRKPISITEVAGLVINLTRRGPQ